MAMENSTRYNGKTLLNGDIYLGYFKGTVPHDKGKYTWSDGTVYEGDWEGGKITGKGKISWPSGATYEGDFAGGYLHGFGSFTGPDGSIYVGAWRMNIQHGLGSKQYCNSDSYEGSWKEGAHDGTGRYTWNTGNTYIGNWKSGNMCGRGVMKWANGDLYDGVWLNGFRDGSGIYKFADGGLYIGTWTRGLKDGKGTFYPAGSKHPPLKKHSSKGHKGKGKSVISHTVSFNPEECESPKPSVSRSVSVSERSTGGFPRNSGRISHRDTSLNEAGKASDTSKEFISHDTSGILTSTSDEGQHEVQESSTVVYEREYMQGVLIKERARNYTERPHKNKTRSKFSVNEVKKRSCVDIFESHRSYYLMLNLQLGIRYTVGKMTPVPMREVRSSDFGDRARIRMYFPKKGSQFTPPHRSIDFKWKDYCPMVFRNLREMFKLDAADYMMSICGDDGLRELSSPGKSGSLFYLSHDDRFVIKTLRRSELKVLLRMLPYYYKHVGKHENTLITKFFGLHQITVGSKKVRFVVMGNMFCTELRIHKRYDLKGSTQGRFTEKEKAGENTTLKDLDLSYDFHMDKLLRESLMKQISLDCKFLESQQIIDYSLLLGLHFRAPALERSASMNRQENFLLGTTPQGEIRIPPKGLLLVTHEPSSVSHVPGPHIRGSALRASSAGDKEVDLVLPETGRVRVQLGVNMPAQANHKLLQDEVDSTEIELFEVFDVVLYLGIIDILQEYNLKKKIENAYKSFIFDPLTISAVQPSLYSKRFIGFLEKVFPDEP